MEEQTFANLEAAQNAANQTFCEDYNAAAAANEKAAAADEAYQQALNDICNEYDGKDMAEKQERLQEAAKAKQEAEAEAEKANEALEASAEQAQAAADALEAKKEEQRKSRTTDMSYVVHTARIECSCAKRESFLTLDSIHGVYTRQIPQMTVQDTILNTNIIEFGRCNSKENPEVIKAAEDAVAAANAEIEANKDWRDHVMDFFIKPEEVQVTDSLLEQCEGKCILELPVNSVWLKGHEKITINGDAPLLRRCELTCKYGGQITILLSGQPE